jgi:transposase
MGEVRRKYTREFKIEALRLISDEGLSFAKVARDLGVNETMLYRWRKELGEDPKEAFPGQGNLKAQAEELRRLRRKLEIVKQERDI